MTDVLVNKAIESVLNGKTAYSKFLSANDSGETGGHQSGILISKSAQSMLFGQTDLLNNHILKKQGRIKWQDDFYTDCTITWYSSKNELRLTGFGKGFQFLRPEYTGALFVLIKQSETDFDGYIFNSDETMQDFLDAFGLTPAETNRPVELNKENKEIREKRAISQYIDGLRIDFPSSVEMSAAARMINYQVSADCNIPIKDPDAALLYWIEAEYKLFRAIESDRYGDKITKGFTSMEEFLTIANAVLNRRKSRAGKSLEHHLSSIFDANKIEYVAQAVTEGKKKPDFLFPSAEAYHDFSFSIDKLCTLAAKTTCKDRWRQILNEADRLRDENKYLCTMQQGISSAQMDEMEAEKVVLVVPKPYIGTYPKEKRDKIWTIARFVEHVKRIEGR